MFYLVWKDLLLTKKINVLLLVLYALFISFVAAKMPILPEILYGFCILMFVYITTIYSNTYDEKGNSEIVLNSLPIKRKEIVKGKYISVVISNLISGFIIIASTNIFAYGGLDFTVRTAGFIDIILSFNLVSIIFSLYYPIYFKLGGSKARLLNMLLYFLVFFTPSVLSRFSEKIVAFIPRDGLFFLGNQLLLLFLFLLCMVIYCLSYHISKGFYQQRDF
ncbi:ABC-2 family transporter protein [Anaerovirgula multivorans]|uniref:ABC-2 family transporter protein n=1 Tax=Anaerovirgula multivorans TaxID=312168 RepID=A0A239JC21_9FIRM|nr:ABC-2 transporter permease [Anaerovirgula multivorans]SNT03377.1 ABC-2 family transporter protein [Anaerovirgula multivorans]